jgi:quercetin dioxygenase-like cupin family protein
MAASQYPRLSFFGKETFTPVLFSNDSFVFDWEMTPGHKVMEHIHPNVDETFNVTEGEITFVINGNATTAHAGDEFTIQRQVAHSIKNDSATIARCRVTYSPSGDQGKFFNVGMFLLGEAPASNGSMSLVFKMMFVSRQMNYEDFSTPASFMGKLVFAVLWAPVKVWGDVAGWRNITRRYRET